MKTHLVDNFNEKYSMINRTSIEDRDRHLTKKFRNIVEEKEQIRAQRNAQAPPRRPWPVFTLAGVIMVATIMFMVYQMRPAPVLSDSSSPRKKAETAAPKKTPPIMAQHTPTKVEKPVLPNEKPVQPVAPETVPAPAFPAEKAPQRPEVVKAPEKTAPMETLPEIVSMTDVTIHELVTCRGIKHRQYVSAENHFSIRNGAKPVVWTWMNVLTDNPPQELSHIYYLNGKRFCRVILPAPYPRTRTWSKITLKKPAYAGSWRVDVVNSNGQVLARTDFTVDI